MAIIKKQPQKRIVIDLTGPEGNAFVLMGYAKNYANAFGLDPNTIINEMMKGNYEDLIKVFDKYFGEFIDLAR